ncbi:DUF2714 domain-containing protein [Mycoplasmopsis alligatoris]|uniref:DUF2714 domain-containing protein n=1 Tax=Mycoplasmopsis alligatoris A21JP2 TaxID=747682 RepID=D4XVL6_9BACT|nr:DUF2714 domain-containing protein [Mycoplasmopsis alligatoris]EFF41686.1 hypothetical protein MALL_0563 [Mycoplasmopsis alligatoris A21JP2]
MKRKSKVQQAEIERFNDTQYKDYSQEKEFVSFQQIVNTALLVNNISRDSDIYKSFLKKIELATEKNLEVVYSGFTISWITSRKFAKVKLIPTIVEKETQHRNNVNFSSGFDLELGEFFQEFNAIIKDLLYSRKRKVEVFPKMIVYLALETNSLKIAFDESVAK